jgi:hypothetical protein
VNRTTYTIRSRGHRNFRAEVPWKEHARHARRCRPGRRDFRSGKRDNAHGFATRRNEIAHSIVIPFEWIVPGTNGGREQYCAAPPRHHGRKFDPNDKPAFAYTLNEMAALTRAVHDYVVEPAQRLKFKLWLGEDGVPPKQS